MKLRWKLTLAYGALFFVAGALLLVMNYGVVSRSIPAGDKVVFTQQVEGPGPGQVGVTRQLVEGEAPPDVIAGGDVPYGFFIKGDTNGPVSIAKLPNKIREDTLGDLLRKSLLGLVAVGAVSLLLGWWLSGRALRPLHRITDTARRLSDHNLDQRIALEGPDDELKELADTFDAMLERLDSAFDSQRRFVANASHELRTPLAIMRAQLEVASTPEELAAAADVVRQTIDRSERLVDGLLVLARADNELAAVPTDLSEALQSAAMFSEDDDPTLTVDADEAPVEGDPALLLHLARNLIDNARRYNAPGGWVRARTRVDGNDAVLEVTNSGEPINPDAVDGLFEPFRRLSPDRTGGDISAGLGLSIVRAVAQAHGGSVTAVTLPEGGLRVEVRLPAALATVSASSRV